MQKIMATGGGGSCVNLRATAAGIYMVMFLVSLLNLLTISSATFREVFPVMFTTIVLGLTGVLIALWVYQDGESIKILRNEIVQLEQRLKALEKS